LSAVRIVPTTTQAANDFLSIGQCCNEQRRHFVNSLLAFWLSAAFGSNLVLNSKVQPGGSTRRHRSHVSSLVKFPVIESTALSILINLFKRFAGTITSSRNRGRWRLVNLGVMAVLGALRYGLAGRNCIWGRYRCQTNRNAGVALTSNRTGYNPALLRWSCGVSFRSDCPTIAATASVVP